MRKYLAAFVLCVLALLFAVAPSLQAAGTPLADTSWVLSSLSGQLPLPGTTIALQFSSDTASGSDGCNRYSIAYTAKGTSITFGTATAADTAGGAGAATTLMACAAPVMDQANTYMAALAAANKYHVSGNHLVLLSGRKVLATFVAGTQDLGGTSWLVTGYNNGNEAVVSVLLGTDLTAVFSADGEVTGSGGCNDYFGAYLTADGAIMFGGLGATRRLCVTPPGIMEQEAAYLAALQTAATYKMEGNQLTLRNGNDAIAVTLERMFAPVVPTPVPGVPTGRVTAPNGVNVRSGPGTNYPVIATAPFGVEGEIVGRSADGAWWAAAIPAAPGGVGWVSAEFVAVTDVQDVPVLAAPPVYVPPAPPGATTPTPRPTLVPEPTATPTPQIAFWATPTVIDQGQCASLNWSVENVQAVWVYPQGQPYQQYPRTGQGSEEVCPPQTTTYEIRVLLRDGTIITQQVTINVVAAAPQNPLNGTAWQATAYNTGGVMASPISGTTLTARFDADQIGGNAGCNDYRGAYFVSGSNISIGSLATGMMTCGEGQEVMQQERDYLAALQSAATFQFDGSRLELRRADGVSLAMFVRLQ